MQIVGKCYPTIASRRVFSGEKFSLQRIKRVILHISEFMAVETCIHDESQDCEWKRGIQEFHRMFDKEGKALLLMKALSFRGVSSSKN